MQNRHYGSKIKIQKNMSKSILRVIYSCSVQKTASKKTNIQEMRPFWKCAIVTMILNIGHHAKPIAFAKSSLWVTNYNSKKPAWKNTKYSRNEMILKIRHNLRPIPSLGQKFRLQKICQNLFHEWFTVVLCKKTLEKTPNIREMRPFWKSAIMQSL